MGVGATVVGIVIDEATIMIMVVVVGVGADGLSLCHIVHIVHIVLVDASGDCGHCFCGCHCGHHHGGSGPWCRYGCHGPGPG